MVTAGEIVAIESALDELRAAAARAQAAADALPWWRSLIPGGGPAGDAAIVAAAELDRRLVQLVAERNALVEAPGYAHELVLSIVERARAAVAQYGTAADHAEQLAADPVGTMQDTATTQLGAVGDAVAPVGAALAWLGRNWQLVAVVALIVLLAPTINAAARLLPRRA